jgi:DNA invertase Pin-like site-specific DNA recombinase
MNATVSHRRPHDPETVEEAKRLAKRGYTDVEIAIKLSVPKSTVSNWTKGIKRGERPEPKKKTTAPGIYDLKGQFWPTLVGWR